MQETKLQEQETDFRLKAYDLLAEGNPAMTGDQKVLANREQLIRKENQ